MVGSNSFFTTDIYRGSMNNKANSQFFWFFKVLKSSSFVFVSCCCLFYLDYHIHGLPLK